MLALRASAGRRRAGATRVVRSYKVATPIPPLPWNRWLFGPGSDGLICVSPSVGARRTSGCGGGVLPSEPSAPSIRSASGPRLPTRRFDDPSASSPSHRVVGIVARAQRHRRFDLLLEAAARLFARDASARLLVIGRGTHIEETAQRPAERLGIADRVIFAGYRTDDYIDVLRCVSVFTFLVPGSDGGCRALLEAAACGLPAVTSARGALPGDRGRRRDRAPGRGGSRRPGRGLARRSSVTETRRAGMGAAARRRAETHFDRSHFAEEVEAFYASLA